MASSSSVNSLPSSAGFSHPLVARRLGVPPSRHPWFHLLVGSWSSSMALLIHGLLPPPLHLAISGSFSISLGLHPLLRCCGSLSCPLLGLSCRSPCLHALLLLGVFLLFAWATGGFVQCSLVSLCRVASTFLFPVCHPCSYGLHPAISMSAFPGYCLFPSSALPFLSLVWTLHRLAWVFSCPASPYLVSISLSFLQVVSSCPSLGALLTRSNLRSTTRRGLPLGRVSFWFASWNFLMVPIPLSFSFRSSLHVLLWALFCLGRIFVTLRDGVSLWAESAFG